MSLSDRRLLVELGVVLIIKLVLITAIKLAYFSPGAEQTVPVERHFLREEPGNGPTEAKPHHEIADKER